MPRGDVAVTAALDKRERLPVEPLVVRDPECGNPVLIPGSLARLTFGESKNEPGYVIVEVL